MRGELQSATVKGNQHKNLRYGHKRSNCLVEIRQLIRAIDVYIIRRIFPVNIKIFWLNLCQKFWVITRTTG